MKALLDKLEAVANDAEFRKVMAEYSPHDDNLINLDQLIWVCRISKKTARRLFPILGGNTGQFALGEVTAVVRELNPQTADVWPGLDPVTGKPGRFLKPAEVAEISGSFVNTDRLSYWRRIGEGPTAIMLGPRLARYRPEDIAEWIALETADPLSVIG